MKFKYVGDDVRVFPSIPATLSPGDVIDADENPHPRYFESVKAAKAAPVEEVTNADPVVA